MATDDKKAESKGLSEIMIHNIICLYQTDDNHWYGKLYEETTFKKLLQNIKNHGYSLPTRREWEYLSGKGCRTIFPWGNNIDFSNVYSPSLSIHPFHMF